MGINPKRLKPARRSQHAHKIDKALDSLDPATSDPGAPDAPWAMLLSHMGAGDAKRCPTCRAPGRGGPPTWDFCGVGRRLLAAMEKAR